MSSRAHCTWPNFALSVMVAVSASADTRFVSPTGRHIEPYGSWVDAATNVQSAVDIAAIGDEVLVTNAVYSLFTQIVVSKAITLRAVSNGGATILDAQNQDRCVYVSGAGASVVGFTLVNGRAVRGGGAFVTEHAQLIDCVVSDCIAEGASASGGGIYCDTGAVVSNCVVTGNSSSAHGSGAGGGIACVGALVVACHVSSNTATSFGLGGGILCSSGGVVRSSTIRYNSAGLGAGVFCWQTGLVEKCTIAMNMALDADDGSGAGIVCASDSEVRDCMVVSNHAAHVGGGILLFKSRVANCSVLQNSAEKGGGIYSYESDGLLPWDFGPATSAVATVHNTTLTGNTAVYEGGGVMCIGGRVTDCVVEQNVVLSQGAGGGVFCGYGGVVKDSLVNGNRAWLGGGIAALHTGVVENCTVIANGHEDGAAGGILCASDSRVVGCRVENNKAWLGGGILCQYASVSSSTIAGNAAFDGGGVFVCESEPPIFDFGDSVSTTSRLDACLIVGNVAANQGGGVFGSGGTIQNCTISDNTAHVVGGGILCTATAFVLNTIIYGNTAGSDFNVATDGEDNVLLYNCSTPLLPGEGNIDADPLLTPAYRLTAASPCIDAGTAVDAPEKDIDGEARWDHPGHSNVVSIVDIGADEFVDTDLDNMADHWEVEHFGCITLHNGTGDADGDALGDLAEYEHGTDPNNPDTDGDAMPDGWEVRHDFDPLAFADAASDVDGDGMSNLAEYIADTDPRDPDSVLSFIRVGRQFNGIRLDWKGGREAYQILECLENLASTTEQWMAILALPPPTALTNAVIDMGATNSALFYRIRAER